MTPLPIMLIITSMPRNIATQYNPLDRWVSSAAIGLMVIGMTQSSGTLDS
ncbi:hypothetical protein [Trichothermofontia sp.]